MTAVHPEASRQAVVEAALVLLERMGLSPADLAAVPQHRKPVPTFAEYVPVVSAAVSAGTRRAYGSYWNRVLEHWGDRRLDEPTPSEIRQLMAYVKTHVVARRNARGGRSAEEHLVAALRCLYQRAVDDGLIAEADNPARNRPRPGALGAAWRPTLPPAGSCPPHRDRSASPAGSSGPPRSAPGVPRCDRRSCSIAPAGCPWPSAPEPPRDLPGRLRPVTGPGPGCGPRVPAGPGQDQCPARRPGGYELRCRRARPRPGGQARYRASMSSSHSRSRSGCSRHNASSSPTSSP